MPADLVLTMMAVLLWGAMALAAVCLVTYAALVSMLAWRAISRLCKARRTLTRVELIPPRLVSDALTRYRTPPLIGDPHKTPSTWIGV